MTRRCSNAQHNAPATIMVMGRLFCDSCARALRLGVPSVPRPTTTTLEDELLDHVLDAFRVAP